MTTPSNELQRFIYQRLTTDATLNAIVPVERVYDDVPEDAPYPFIQFGQANWIEDDAECITGTEHFLILHVYTRVKGFREVKEICDLIKRRLHRINTTTAFTDHALHSIWVQTVDIMDDPQDSLTRHGVVRVEAIIEETVT